ncbi:hypothetical protein D3C81_1977300 [compost metagenome]
MGIDAVFCQRIHYGLLQQRDQFAYPEFAAFQIQQDIHHLLTWSVVGHLPAAIALNNRDITGNQYMLRFTRLPLGENRQVLNQPDLIGRVVIA